VGDVNGDGNVDLVIVNQSGPSLGVLVNRGDATFDVYGISGAVLGPNPDSAHLTVADVNSDGFDDVLLVPYADQPPYLFLSTGDPNNPIIQAFSGSVTGCQGGAIADLNNDGHPDVIVGCGDMKMQVAFGDGTGNFGPFLATTTLIGDALRPSAADFDGDGWIDVIVSDYTNITVFYNNQDGTFDNGVHLVTSSDLMYMSAGDFDGDGYPDILAAGVPMIHLFKNNGNRTFGDLQTYPATNLVGVTAVDVNRDGQMDTVVSSSSEGAILYLNLGCPN
jgi:hypothetical protein